MRTNYMMTPDKDYGQLVSDKVFMYRPKHTGGFEVMGVDEVKAKFDIQSPAQVIDMLGLMGDSSTKPTDRSKRTPERKCPSARASCTSNCIAAL